METEMLSAEECRLLLSLARQSIERVVCGQELPALDLESFPARLREQGVCFVTLTLPDGELRGCIGGLEPTDALAVDVSRHAAAAALEDYRFLPVRPAELDLLQIEISRLTRPQQLVYEHPEDLPGLLKPYEDGVVLRDGPHRATFLPQVWEKLHDPCAFLSHLCQKMGAPADLWRRRILQVEIYHVQEFREGME